MRDASLDRVLSEAAANGEIPGMVAAAVLPGGEIYQGAFGRRDISKPDQMTGDTLFWIASMTKPVVSAAAMQLVEQGKVTLDQDLGRILPALARPQVLEGWDASGAPRLRPARAPITLRRLLTHTAGFSYELWNEDIVRYQKHAGLPGITSCEHRALMTPLVADPGTCWEYGINIDYVGKLIEALSGERLDAYLASHLFAPLGMTETTFRIRPDQRPRLAAMHARAADGRLTPMPFEVPQEPEFHMGGGGLYGTAADYLAFCRMILNQGELNGARVLRPDTVKLMARNQIGPLSVARMKTSAPAATNDAEFFPGMVKKWGFGFMISTEAVPGRRAAQSLAWAGLANTYFWIDPASRVAGVMLAQILPFADAKVLALLDSFETELYRSGKPALAA